MDNIIIAVTSVHIHGLQEAATYSKMFIQLKECVMHMGDSQPKIVITDFEKAVFKAVEEVFPTVEHKGCRFHLHQAVYRKMGQLGLQSLVLRNPAFQELYNKIKALSYVPLEEVVSFYLEDILKSAEDLLESEIDWKEVSDEIEEFLLYMQNTWIQRRSGRSPLYAPALWNHYQTILEDGIETNNMLESFNSTWNRLLGKHPNVWTVTETFVSTEADTRRCFMANTTGSDLTSNSGRKEASREFKSKIKLIVSNFSSTPRGDYLSMLAHQLSKPHK